jgi:MraZ protein
VGQKGSLVYFGEFQTVLDDKGRITVASQLRKTMEVLKHTDWYMTRGFDGSVFLFPQDRWDEIRKQSGGFATLDSRAIDFRRMFFGSVAEVRPDRQGRVQVPQHLREFAGLDAAKNKEAVLIGCDDHLELWSRDGWRQYQQGLEAQYKVMGRELFSPEANGGTVASE